MPVEADAIVIGGGPAGATAATVMAMDGRRVVLIERERFPRYHVGESLLPATVQGVCRFLGVEREIARAGFTRKFGATFRWGPSEEPWHVGFAEAVFGGHSGRPVFAYQVERSKFDAILLANARRHGVRVRAGWRAVEAIAEGGRVSGVIARDAVGRATELRAPWVVDASGQAGVLATKLGRRDYDPFFRNIAVFGYFAGGRRQAGPRRGNVMSAAFRDGWIWYIPLADGLTSVGAVVRPEEAATIRRIGAPAALARYIAACPIVAAQLAGVARVARGALGETRVMKDYSYSTRTLWTGGAALVGDAAMFIDPLFSSGVHLATYSGLLAARAINTCLAGELDEARAFGEFARRYRREFAMFYEFLFAFYEAHLDDTSAFWTARKMLGIRGAAPREALVRLLAGLGQAEGEPGAMAGVLRSLERQMDAMRATMAGRAPGGVRARELRQRLRTQARERLSLHALSETAGARRTGRARTPRPLFTDGLVPSADGLRWRVPRSGSGASR